MASLSKTKNAIEKEVPIALHSVSPNLISLRMTQRNSVEKQEHKKGTLSW
jgi:hypothetical protein